MYRLQILIAAVCVLPRLLLAEFPLYLSARDEQALFRAIEYIESEAIAGSIGDIGLVHKAYGVYQIRRPYLEDVNRVAGHATLRTQGVRELTLSHVLDDRNRAQWAVRVYLSHYGSRYTRITGKPATPYVYAAIHNGGPNGWRKPAARAYARRVTREMLKYYGQDRGAQAAPAR